MPLWLLVSLVVGGIAAIALALHLLGLSRAPRLTDKTARQAWQRAYPESPVERIRVISDGNAALVTAEEGSGIVWRFGADSCARFFGDQTRIMARGQSVVLKLGDFTAPRIHLRLTEEEQADLTTWMNGK